MWMFTTFGFFSVVEKGRGDLLCVRARAREDLDRLRQRYLPALSETESDVGTDYEHRAWVARADLSSAIARILDDLHYSNFKSEVEHELGHDRAHTYLKVWRDLREVAR